jgi:hypothetical protein
MTPIAAKPLQARRAPIASGEGKDSLPDAGRATEAPATPRWCMHCARWNSGNGRNGFCTSLTGEHGGHLRAAAQSCPDFAQA